MRIALYGNNLDAGVILARGLRALGHEARLYAPAQAESQDQHAWWSSQAPEPGLVRPVPRWHPGSRRPGVDPRLRDELASYDVLCLSEEGPALLGDIRGPAKVFLSYGGDLQLYPFRVAQQLAPRALLAAGREAARTALAGLRRGDPTPARRLPLEGGRALVAAIRLQRRQRAGLRRCSAFLVAGYQLPLLRRLGLSAERATCLPVPCDPHLLGEVDLAARESARQATAGLGLVLLHPTRQFWLRLDGNPFLKDNHKLLRACAGLLPRARTPARLYLLRKGRPDDIAASERLVRELRLEPLVEWLPELPHRLLRAWYELETVVVCDQFNPSLPSLGSIGREATWFGRPLVTAFDPASAALTYGDPAGPPNLFPATSEGEILAALERVEEMSAGERLDRAAAARAWFAAHLSVEALAPRYAQVFEQARRARIVE